MSLQDWLIIVFLVFSIPLEATFNWEFQRAVQRDDIATVTAMLQQNSELAKQYEGNKHTPLHWAQSRAMAELLVAHGADIYARSRWNDTPLHYAAHHGHKEVIEFFLDKGMDISIRGDKNSTALRRASWNNHLEIVKYLIEKGAGVNTQSGWDNYTALHGAVYAESLEMVQFLVEEAKINTRIKTTSGKTALEYAREYLPQARDKEAVQSIIRYLETVTPVTPTNADIKKPLSWNLKKALLLLLIIFVACYTAKKIYDKYQQRKRKNDLVLIDEDEVINNNAVLDINTI